MILWFGVEEGVCGVVEMWRFVIGRGDREVAAAVAGLLTVNKCLR